MAEQGGQLRVTFNDTSYEFPRNEVQILPLDNITMENLARYVGDRLAEAWKAIDSIDGINVEVSETRGQRAMVTR